MQTLMLIITLKVGQIERSLTTNFGSRLGVMRQSFATTAGGITICEEFTWHGGGGGLQALSRGWEDSWRW